MAAVFYRIEELAGLEIARLRRVLSKSVIGTALALLAVVAGLEGLAVILVGGYASLARTQPPWVAGLVVGGIMLLVAGVVLGFVVRQLRGGEHPPRPALPPRRHREMGQTDTPSLLGAAAAELIGTTRIKAKDVALAALVAGLALGFSPRLRHRVFGHPSRDQRD